MPGCAASWIAGVGAGVASCVVSPLDRPCDEGELDAPLGSELCSVAGAVLCVLGVEVCDGGGVVPVECAPWPGTVPGEVERFTGNDGQCHAGRRLAASAVRVSHGALDFDQGGGPRVGVAGHGVR
ncbi:MAG: hypothetical protein ACRDRS_19210 [Pseudonocardiaceae bacterium]